MHFPAVLPWWLLLGACTLPPGGPPPPASDAGAPARCSAQSAYTFPGCADEDYGCPRLGTMHCAFQSILAAHLDAGAAGCSQDADCAVAAPPQRCSSVGMCPAPALNRQQVAAFLADVAAEEDCYCAGDNPCGQSGQCMAVLAGSLGAQCCQGTCVLRHDAGACL